MKPAHFTTRALFEYLQMRESATVPEIANRLKVPTPTVTGILNRLIQRGLVSRCDEAVAGRRGRPRIAYRLRLPGVVAAFKWDGTQLAGALVDAELRTLAAETEDVLAVRSMPEAIAHIAAFLKRLAGRSAGGQTAGPVQGAVLNVNAVSIGGQTITSSVLPWANEHLGQALANALRLPVRLLTGQHVTQEYRKLPDPPPRSMCLLRAGDGVSAHMLDAGQYLAGRHSLAGELGHVTVDPSGILCGCGRRGCLETICSGPAISRRAVEDLRHGVRSELRLAELELLPPRDAMQHIWQAWERGDTFAHAMMDSVFDKLAWGLGLVVNLFDPDVILAGGYVFKDRPEWIGEVERRAQRWILHAAKRRTTLFPAQATLQDELIVAACGFHSQAVAGEVVIPQPAPKPKTHKAGPARRTQRRQFN
jgi:glucokinase